MVLFPFSPSILSRIVWETLFGGGGGRGGGEGGTRREKEKRGRREEKFPSSVFSLLLRPEIRQSLFRKTAQKTTILN